MSNKHRAMQDDEVEGTPAAESPAPASAGSPELMRGISIGGGGHGPAGPVANKTERGKLCDLLKLREPNDEQLCQAASAEIVELRAKLAK